MEEIQSKILGLSKAFLASAIDKVKSRHPTAIFAIGAGVIVFLLAVANIGRRKTTSVPKAAEQTSSRIPKRQRAKSKNAKVANAVATNTSTKEKPVQQQKIKTAPPAVVLSPVVQSEEEKTDNDSNSENDGSPRELDTKDPEPTKEISKFTVPIPKKAKQNKKKKASAAAPSQLKTAASDLQAPSFVSTADASPIDDEGGWIAVTPTRRRRTPKETPMPAQIVTTRVF